MKNCFLKRNSIILGKDDKHLFLDSRIGKPLHEKIISPFIYLKDKAQRDSFDLKVLR